MLCVVLAVLVLNGLVLATASANVTIPPQRNGDVHPYCRCADLACQPFTREIVDITETLRAVPGIPEGACIFNPALIRVNKSLFCIFARIYIARSAERKCVPGRLDRPPFMDAWNGTLANLLLMARIRRRTMGGGTSVTIVGHRYLNYNFEDGRVFKDQRGLVYLYVSLPFGQYGGDRASVNTVFRIHIKCRRDPSLHCDPRLGPPRLLRYDRSIAWDKNWVPWNGTSAMSYSHYGPFGPHSVFNWSSYTEPVPHARFDSVAIQSFFPAFSATFGKLIQLSGGTTAIVESTGLSYLAVGHVRVHPACLHPHAIPGLDKLIGNSVLTNCGHMLKLSPGAKDSIPFRSFMFPGPDGTVHKHYHVDYAFFLYRFSAVAPYNVTHISHGFVPPSDGHFGIAFPSALERFGNQYGIAYGDADQAAKIMFLQQSDINKLLIPLAVMEQRLTSYSLCTLPFPEDLGAEER